MFKANVGGVDRAARLLVGAVLLTVAAWFEVTSGGWRGGVVGLIGLFVFVSGLTRFCILIRAIRHFHVRRAGRAAVPPK